MPRYLVPPFLAVALWSFALTALGQGVGGLTLDERRWLTDHPVVRVAPDPDFPPVEFFDADGRYRGIAADFIELVELKSGLQFEIVRLASWDEVLSQAKARQVDMFGAAAPTPQRAEYMAFTAPYIEVPAVILVRNDVQASLTLEQMKGMRVAVISGYAAHDYLSQHNPGIRLDVVPDMRSGLRKVSLGMVDAMVANLATASHYIGEEGITNLRVAGESGYVYRLAFAARKDWPQLTAILEKGLARITPAERQAIIARWIRLGSEERIDPRLWRWVGWGGVALIGIIVLVLGWNRALQRQVRARIAELRRELAERRRAEEEVRHYRDNLEALVERRTAELTRTQEALLTAKEEADRANRAKSLFLAAMSHEIRTPMNSILGMGELLRETPLDRTQSRYLDTLERAGDTLLGIISDILDLSRIEAGQLEMEQSPFDLHEQVEWVVEMLGVHAHNKELTVRGELAPDLPRWVKGDASRLRQILINLVGNAVKFTEEGEVALEVAPVEWKEAHGLWWVRATVSDTGPGIPEEKLERIFDAFSQADPSITRRHGGTGLGLAIARRLTELMGGSLSVESRPGEGSIFTVQLPLEAAASPVAETVPRAAAAETGGGGRILLAEDSEDNRLLVEAFLHATPYSVDWAADGRQAVERFVRGGYDLVLMDIQMPLLDGYGATREIRRWEREQGLPHTPILALTAHAFAQDHDESREAGCDDHLTKPIKKRVLLEALARHLH
ncbi:ATP-binding protein [Endothiovibrio diazotrophicus]